MPDDPNWPRANSLLQRPGRGAADIAVLGIPMTRGSLSGGRFDLAPSAIRSALERFSTFDGERDLGSLVLDDLDDLPVADAAPSDALERIRSGVADAESGTRGAVALLGGDNSVTLPALLGVADHANAGVAAVGLLTLDAHHDLRDTTGGLNNGNPVRALLEAGLPGENIRQIGIQPFANSAVYADVAREAKMGIATSDKVRARGIEAVMTEALDDLTARCEVIYVDLDVDVLDRAFAPACPGSRPGGLMPWELHRAAFLAGAHPKVAAVDIVEVDPERDVADVTVMNAARCLLSFAAGLATRHQQEGGAPSR